MQKIRNDWSFEELQAFYNRPLFELISDAHQIHREFHPLGVVQVCTIISVKTGGCTEDCKYCAQAARYQTEVKAGPMMNLEEVLAEAKKAKMRGATRICLGAAWREVRDNKPFEDILQMVREIHALGVEVCCTLGMLKEHQILKLKEAGLYAYNHNLDSSESYYKSAVTTRTYQERLNTLETLKQAKVSICCGGILGIGEKSEDRLELLRTLANRNPHPESVPINRLEAVPGTPFANQLKVSAWELTRIIAIARILMPKAMIRLSGGRLAMSLPEQALCFFAGANSIHLGEKLLTVPNQSIDKDEELFQLLGLKKQPAFYANFG